MEDTFTEAVRLSKLWNDAHNKSTSTSTSTSNPSQRCKGCDKFVAGGTYISGVFYCPMCTSIINKNNNTTSQSYNIHLNPNKMQVNDNCKNCSKHPENGGDGICHCILGLSKITY